MRVAVIGANGQLGTDIVRAFSGHELIPWNRADFDIRDGEQVSKAILGARPDVIINTAAFHKTDACEDEPVTAFAVNARALRDMAQACQVCDAVLVHISTDYVFSGEKGTSYVEEDPPDPINVYGKSKLAGERLVAAIGVRHYIVRVASLFGTAGSSGKGGNFVESMLAKARSSQSIQVVCDVAMSPTYTADAAHVIRSLVDADAPSGIYHVTNSGVCSWYEFAEAIFALSSVSARLTRCSIEELAPRARRPRNSSLDSLQLRGMRLGPLRGWREALRDYLCAKGHLQG